MQFGVFCPFQVPRPWTPHRERDVLAQMLEQVELADRIGVQYCWAQEHHFLEEYSHSSAPEVYLGALSQRTKRIRLGYGVSVMPPPINHPARVAERVAMLDLVSGGRVEWGTGESGTRIELEGFGVPYVDKRAMWQEAVAEAAKMMAAEPYPGHQGPHFRMPSRNLVPKPLQRPHPPLWVACSNRPSLRHAAKNGVGALTFAFVDANEARFWVEEYHEVFARECVPLGRAVNPRVAMLTQFFVHRDGATARALGVPGSRFFGYGLSHYFRTGSHVPGETKLWDAFSATERGVQAGEVGIGTPAEVREHFEAFERAGVDQLILLQQAGNLPHAATLESLELFGAEVLPDFIARDEKSAPARAAAREPMVARAMARISPLPAPPRDAIDCYPVAAARLGASPDQYAHDQGPLSSVFWRLVVGGVRAKGQRA